MDRLAEAAERPMPVRNGGNGGVAEGGGIYSTLIAGVTNCTFSTNVVFGGGGGIAYYYSDGTPGTPGQLVLLKVERLGTAEELLR